MATTPEHDERIAQLTFASVYPHYVTKVEKKGRTKEELHEIIEWLTGFDEPTCEKLIEEKVTFKTFFERANLNPNADLIKDLKEAGVKIAVCGQSLRGRGFSEDMILDEVEIATSMLTTVTHYQNLGYTLLKF